MRSSTLTSTKDVVEGAQESIAFHGRHVGGVDVGDALLHVEDGLSAAGVVASVKLHVQLSEVKLSHGHHSGPVRPLLLELLEGVLRERLASLVVFGEAVHGLFVVAPVLLARYERSAKQQSLSRLILLTRSVVTTQEYRGLNASTLYILTHHFAPRS